MKKQSLFIRTCILIFSLFFCLIALITTTSGMILGSVRSIISTENLSEMIGDFGGVLTAITGNEKHSEKTLSQMTLEKLDADTIEKYNLTEENLDKIYETDEFKEYLSEKMENAMSAAAEGSKFEMSSTEIIDVLRKSETEFTQITGITMSEDNYTELESAVVNAGYGTYSYDFSQMGVAEGFAIFKAVFSSRLDLIMYGVTALIFLVILLFNRRNKRRTLLYAGGVVAICGYIFINLEIAKNALMGIIGSESAKVLEPVINLLLGSAISIGKTAWLIGLALLGAYVIFLVLSIVKRAIRK